MTRLSCMSFKWIAMLGLLASLITTDPTNAMAQFQDPGQNAAQEPATNTAVSAASEPPPSLSITISDEPKTVDPTTLIPAQLAARATVRFDGKPLKEIVKWLQSQSLNVSIDYPALAAESILVGEPISDHLDDAPIYLLLNRLRIMGLDWHYENETVLITTQTEAQKHLMTVPYNVGDLRDDGYSIGGLMNTIQSAIDAKWEADGDEDGGSQIVLGDVLFIHQTFAAHTEVSGLLTALRKHGRRTFICDPSSHEQIRAKLQSKITVDFADIPLNSAINLLAQQAQLDIRIDARSLAEESISDRTLITLRMTDRPLLAVLESFRVNFQITWTIRDGVLWIMTVNKAAVQMKAAVFDVRDLCRASTESSSLMLAIESQTKSKWVTNGDEDGGKMAPPKLGVVVIRQSEQVLDEISALLENYRKALRASKRRPAVVESQDDILTRYYRLERDVAKDLESVLVELVEPQSWESPARPDADGTIRLVASNLENVRSRKSESDAPGNSSSFLVPNSVLIVKQTRRIHIEIEKVIKKIQHGEPPLLDDLPRVGAGMGGGMGGMGGGGMGGFGGGYFSVPTQ